MLGLAAAFVLALTVSFAVSSLQAALFSLSKEDVARLERLGQPGARFASALKLSPVGFLATLWALRIAAIATAALSAYGLASQAIDSRAVSVFIAVAGAVLLVLLVEIIARATALRNTERVSLTLSMPIWMVSRMLLVLIRPLEALARSFAGSMVQRFPRVSEREIRELVSQGSEEPPIEEHEKRLIEKAFLLDETTAYDVMIPRVDVFAWPETMKLADIVPELTNLRYSRVPLYNGSIDKITGVLYIRDAFRALVSGQRDVELRFLAREPFFVPRSLTLDKLLLEFQTKRIHLGIVIDEYGGVDGVITLEDILEELVGEIVDESDIAAEPIIRLGGNEILVTGGADLREINQFFNTTLPQSEHRSLNGYLLDVFGQVPSTGEKLVKDGLMIEIAEATDTQVVSARLSRVAPGIEGGSADAGVNPGTSSGTGSAT